LLVPGDNKICFAVQLASGLCFLHSHGILHHDIKTDNALLDANHSVCKLADFGLASLILAKGKNTVTVGGTLRYLAPEVVEDAHRQAREMRDRGDARSVSSSLSLSLGRTLVSFESAFSASISWHAASGGRPSCQGNQGQTQATAGGV